MKIMENRNFQLDKIQSEIVKFLATTLDFEALDDIQRIMPEVSEEDIQINCEMLVIEGFLKCLVSHNTYALNIPPIV